MEKLSIFKITYSEASEITKKVQFKVAYNNKGGCFISNEFNMHNIRIRISLKSISLN